MSAQIELPEWSEPLFQPYRYKVIYGGRGSSKSWSVARALLLQGARSPLRVLCAREVQKSLKESVHQLLKNSIESMGLGNFYEVLETEIRGRNGTTFTFAGLQNHTVESIKSYEAVDRVWVEEGQTVSAKSWTVLTPTVRKPGSEIWITFNPSLDTDDTWKRFIVDTPPRSLLIEVNWQDNPYFPAELEEERLHCLATDPEGYKNIWGGQCRAAVEGAIYAEEMVLAVKERRITLLPYDPMAKVHAIFDLGWNDSTSIIMVQKIGPSALAVIDYLEDSHQTIDFYAKELNDRRYNWGDWYVPHDAEHKDLKTGTTIRALLQKMRKDKRKPKMIPNIAVESGIKMGRQALRVAYFDKAKCERLLECLKRYRRHVNNATNEPGSPVHDEFSHGADAWRYLGVVASDLSNEDQGVADAPVVEFGVFDEVSGY